MTPFLESPDEIFLIPLRNHKEGSHIFSSRPHHCRPGSTSIELFLYHYWIIRLWCLNFQKKFTVGPISRKLPKIFNYRVWRRKLYSILKRFPVLAYMSGFVGLLYWVTLSYYSVQTLDSRDTSAEKRRRKMTKNGFYLIPFSHLVMFICFIVTNDTVLSQEYWNRKIFFWNFEKQI